MSVAADLDALLACIAAHNGAINALVDVDPEGARAAAVAADVTVQEPRSAVDGMTIAIKANIQQQRRVADAASAILADVRAVEDATCVARLRSGGAILVGTSNMDEFGMGSSTERSVHGPTRNPWDHTRSAGGSSGGAAAAVAAGFVTAALGTDTGGSVRQPAAFCGVVGFKPTYGRISRRGVIAYASSLDQVGIIADTIDDVARVASVVCGPDDGDATTVAMPLPSLARTAGDDVTGLRVGVPRALLDVGGDALDPDIKEAIERTARDFAAQGAVVVDVELPAIEHAVSAYYVIATAEASSNLLRYDGVRFGPRGDDVTTLQSLYENTRGLFGAEVRRRILLGTFVLSHGFYEAYLVQAQRVRRVIADGFTAAFADCDVILMPTTPKTAFALGEITDPLTMYLADLYTVPASLAGLPAISVPVGLSSSQLPIGAQLIGRPYDEGTLVRAARAVAGHLRSPWPSNTERVQP